MTAIDHLYFTLKKPLTWLLLFFSLYGAGTTPLRAQQSAQLPLSKTRLLFVLDASGSMLAPWDVGTRMDAAKNLLSFMVDSLRTNPQVELGLRVYGHQAQRQNNDCRDSKLEVGFSQKNHDAIIKTLKAVQPKGNTPLAYSLEEAAKDFPAGNQYRNILILITDGLESCGGDPCAVSLALQKKKVFLQPFVIALSQEAGMEQQFNCMGDYYDASNITRFRAALNKALRQSLGKTSLQVQLLDEQNRPRQTDLNMSFVNSATGEVMYNFIHFLDSRGRPDSIFIDPVPAYSIIVNTLPPVVQHGIVLEGGTHNTISIKAPEGVLRLQQQNHWEYAGGVRALVRLPDQAQTLHIQAMGSDQKYLAGTYDIEVHTLPKVYFRSVKIDGGQTRTLTIPAPGILNVRSDVASWSSLYLLKEGGLQELILQLEDKNSINSLALQPGDYRLVYRAKNAQGSKFTQIKELTISSGKTVNLNLFGR
ncbi:von willebrand factor type a [Flammeovirgaceae bacterium 311]|nr:von willebrand factor type a [Flammeovirgaceae bacterium 311]